MGHHGGYAGVILEIDLTTQYAARRPLPEDAAAQLLGGKALAARLLLEQLTGKETALSEENPLVLATAPLTGTGAPGSARFDLGALSPKDDRPAIANCGGRLGIRLKAAGYDALILRGRCQIPTWLEISGDQVRFHPADDLWGLGTGACRERLADRLAGQTFASMCIGPAGEHLVKFASVVTDGHSTGRAGLGAVLGWKQLKAITVEGSQPLPLRDEAAAREANRRWYAQLRQLAPETPAGTVCTACPLHCPRHNRGEDSLLDELGMDAFAAKAVAGGRSDPALYRAIARNELPEGAVLPRDKGGKRRGGGDGRIAGAFGLTSDSAEFCKHYTEAVCCLGQCMFTLNGLTPETGAQPLLDLLNAVTGRALTLPDLLTIGARSRKLQRALLSRFE